MIFFFGLTKMHCKLSETKTEPKTQNKKNNVPVEGCLYHDDCTASQLKATFSSYNSFVKKGNDYLLMTNSSVARKVIILVIGVWQLSLKVKLIPSFPTKPTDFGSGIRCCKVHEAD